MAKFNNSRDSEGRGRSDRNKGERKGRSEGSGDGDKKKKDGYKAKRSFSKNKIFREIKETRGDRKGKPSGEGRQSFKRPFERNERSQDRPFRDRSKFGTNSDRFEKSAENDKPFRERRDDRPAREERPRKQQGEREERGERRESGRKEKKPFVKKDKFDGFKKANTDFAGGKNSGKEKKPRFKKPRKNEETEGSRRVNYSDFEEGKAFSRSESKEKKSHASPSKNNDDLIRLNKYLSNAGVASRRDADALIQSGVVKVNGVVVDQLGYKIKPGDKVTYGDAAVKAERKVYLLLNKPKDYITTVDDPRERKTVMELIAGACRERIYPVGRLDRNTTGLLLFTNDGELTTKLTHPKFGVKKVYHVSLNKGLKPEDFKAITEGVELEDGFVKADDLAFVGEGKKEVGIEIHSGRNRIVRRLFEHLGYDVIKLDRVVFAGLTKKDLPRGKHRFLTAKEISFLQMIG